MYGEWSTIVDCPITFAMTLSEFVEYYEREYGRSGLYDLPERMARVEATGTSSHSYKTVDELIEYNRAGINEECLTKEQLIEKFDFDRLDP
jgi:hypothetical protein